MLYNLNFTLKTPRFFDFDHHCKDKFWPFEVALDPKPHLLILIYLFSDLSENTTKLLDAQRSDVRALFPFARSGPRRSGSRDSSKNRCRRRLRRFGGRRNLGVDATKTVASRKFVRVRSYLRVRWHPCHPETRQNYDIITKAAFPGSKLTSAKQKIA